VSHLMRSLVEWLVHQTLSSLVQLPVDSAHRVGGWGECHAEVVSVDDVEERLECSFT